MPRRACRLAPALGPDLAAWLARPLVAAGPGLRRAGQAGRDNRFGREARRAEDRGRHGNG